MFVTVIFLVLEDELIKKSQKEVSITVLTMFFDSGVMTSSILGFTINYFFNLN